MSVGVEGELGEADVADLVHLELERGDDAEVGAGAADAPRTGRDSRRRSARTTVPSASTISTAAQVVDGQAVLAGQPADAAGGGEPADADAAVVAGAERPAVRRERCGDVRPAGAGPDPDAAGAPRRAPRCVFSARQVDDDAAVVRASGR